MPRRHSFLRPAQLAKHQAQLIMGGSELRCPANDQVELLELERLPSRFIVLGGGYIGLEFAQAMRRFAAEVTVIQRRSQLAAREDPDIGAALFDLFKDEGIDVMLGAEVRRVNGVSGDAVQVVVEQVAEIEGTDLLIATGRTPNTGSIGLDQLGVEVDEHGYIKVNDRLETTAENVWAMGDCAGSPQFTHVAYGDFRVVRDNLNGGSRSTRDRLVPSCVFTDPEFVRVGLNEREAERLGIKYRLARMSMSAILRTRTVSEPRGLKLLIGGQPTRSWDFRLWNRGLTESRRAKLLAGVQTAMLGGMPSPVLGDGNFTHQTIAEGLVFLLANVSPPSAPEV